MTLDVLQQQVSDLEKDTLAGHKRLRETLALLKDEIDRVGAEQRMTAHDLDLLRRTPIDATKLMLSTKSILALIFGVVAIIASYWNLTVKIDAEQSAFNYAQQTESVQLKALGDAVADAKATAADAKRQYELMRYDFQALKDQVQKGK